MPCLFLLLSGLGADGAEPSPVIQVGVARVDVTPDYPVRLSGYGSRSEPSQGVTHPIWAKAMALGSNEGDGPAVLLAVDNCGVPSELAERVRQRLAPAGVRGDRLMVCSSHTHSAPWLVGYAPFLAQDILPEEHQRHREQYTEQLENWMVQAVQQALENRRPARLSWNEGKVSFAANRRVLQNGAWTGFGVQPGAPVDHRLPVLVARDMEGKPLAIWTSYACHCTTLGGDFNQICGDWSGFAQQYLEADFPSAVSLITIGCGADANPEPRGKLEFAEQHGRLLADEVKRLLSAESKELPGPLTCRTKQIELPFDRLPDRATWEQRASIPGSEGNRAKHFLATLDRGEAIPQTLPYPMASWTFGEDLAIVFLAGEVVVDYALRAGTEFDVNRLWVVAYANDVPCYIASKRILGEGGYEADSSMIYYGRPTRLAPRLRISSSRPCTSYRPRRLRRKASRL